MSIRFFQNKILNVFLLTISTIFLWSFAYGKTSKLAWLTPVTYSGDSIFVLAISKAYMDSEITQFSSKLVSKLGAPYGANWNDYPFSEDILFQTIGSIAKLFGLFPASNIALLLAHILAGLSFWYVGTKLKYKQEITLVLSILFAFSNFIFFRNLPHITISFYFHVPLIILLFFKNISSSRSLPNREYTVFGVLVSILTGILNPYFLWMQVQLLAISIIFLTVRKRYDRAFYPCLFLLVTIAFAIFVNLDSQLYSFENGKNPNAIQRNLSGLEIYSLKLPDLFLPPPQHRLKEWANFSQENYYQLILNKGEQGSPYLGLIAIFSFGLLFTVSIFRFFQNRFKLIPVHFWTINYILLYSMTGGIGLLFGSFGLILFRSGNRYSIFILTLLLLYIARELSRKISNKLSYPICILLLVLGIWDQFPPRQKDIQIQNISQIVSSDAKFAEVLEAKLPKDAMVFQLPILEFPESPPIHKLQDYDHFRLYLHSKNLKYSYGTNKGRPKEEWQKIVSVLEPAQMIRKLEEFGFSVILISKKGFIDEGKKIATSIERLQKRKLSENDEFVAFQLNPSDEPILPDYPIFSTGWSLDEGKLRWSNASKAEILFTGPKNLNSKIQFSLFSVISRKVSISINGQLFQTIDLEPGMIETSIRLDDVRIDPKGATLSIETPTNPSRPGNGDSRKLSFGIKNLKLIQE